MVFRSTKIVCDLRSVELMGSEVVCGFTVDFSSWDVGSGVCCAVP